MNRRKFMPRKLSDRSHITFEFPQRDSYPLKIRLPFYENIELNEINSANLAEQLPLGRNGRIVSWTGSPGRVFRLTFNLTLPLLIEQALSFSNFIEIALADNKEEARKTFFLNPSEAVLTQGSRLLKEYLEILRKEEGGNYLSAFLSENRHLNGEEVRHIINTYNNVDAFPKTGVLEAFNGLIENITEGLESFSSFIDNGLSLIGINPQPATEPVATAAQVKSVISWWVNVIRSCVLSNSTDSIYGPPIVRLNHGILFREIPTVCGDYNLSFLDDAGYDIFTLLPRRIKISMTLLEVRTGNFGKYRPGVSVERDNVTGWESILEGGYTLDPEVTDRQFN